MALKARYLFMFRMLLLLLLAGAPVGCLLAQDGNSCSIRNGRMYIELKKNTPVSALRTFIGQYHLEDLQLEAFAKRNDDIGIRKMGWSIDRNTASEAVLSRAIKPVEHIYDASQRIRLTSAADKPSPRTYGINSFRNKRPFRVQDSVVLFYLRGNTDARRVRLAGSFTNWESGALDMKKTDTGWVASVKLPPGKYWYKFVADGNWFTDNDNLQNESDGHGNINSVFFVINRQFRLPGFTNARQVMLAGSFNNWRNNELRMVRADDGWLLSLYLAEGTHTYRFVADGNWMIDPTNPNKLPDGSGNYNSVIRIGQAFTFVLSGFTEAKKVSVAGNFNNWKGNELFMERTATGWQLPYVLGPGNYEYKFVVDGRWMADPANGLNTGNASRNGNSVLVVAPNYTFRLKGKEGLKNVFLAGDFNNWNTAGYPMRREGSDWVVSLYLSPGKHRYKYYGDGKWFLDPGNKLWEQNEFNTGNSVLWIE